jgi:hypothetical protein
MTTAGDKKLKEFLMSNVVRYVFALVASAPLWLGGCASGPDVRGEYDHAVDFGKFRTYGFVAQLSPGADTTQFKSLAMQTLQSAAAMEMEKRGYKRADAPDLVINFKGKLEEKTDIESTPSSYYGPGWGYHGWYGAPYGGYGGSEVTTRRYNVGTLVMDVVDRQKQQAVFQGGLQTTVSKEMMENREAALRQAVAQIFAKYPFVAGQSAPVVVPEQK